MDLVQIVIGFVLGALIGAAGGLFGIGGGLLAIPVLGLFFGLDEQHAQGTAMIMVAPNVFVALRQYARSGGFDRRLAATLAASAVPFTYLGAHYAVSIPSAPLRRGFACFLLALGVYFLVRALRTRANVPAPARTALPWPWAALVGAGGGALSGIFSVGGAVFAVPFTAVMFGLSQAAAQGLGLALVAPGTLVGLEAYVRAGDVDWQLGLPLAAGGVLFVRYGVTLAHRLPERTMRVLFTLLLGLSAAGLLLKA